MIKGRTSFAFLAAVLVCAAVLSASVGAATNPKLLKVVTGRPFEPVPAIGSSTVSITLCPEETEPATFTASYTKPLAKVRVAAAADFTGPGKPAAKLARNNIRVSQVVSGQLMNQISASSGAVFTEPDLGPQPVQFWVDVTVPRRTPPGVYKGNIGFYYQNKTFDVLPMEITVLPLRLVGSSKQYEIHTAYGPGAPEPATLAGDDYERFLRAFGELGVRMVSVVASPEQMPETLSCYASSGLSSPVCVSSYSFGCYEPAAQDAANIEEVRRNLGFTRLVYFCEDNPISPEQIEVAKQQLTVLRRARVTTAARLSSEEAYTQLEPQLDQLSYSVDMPRVQSYISGITRPQGIKWQWYWWNARESAIKNRRYAGVGLWMSGLYGCTPEWMPTEGMEPLDGLNGMLGMSLREGIDDTRYLTTFYKALRELKDLKRERDKEYIEMAEAYVVGFLRKPLDTVTIADLIAFRSKLASYSIQLGKRL